MMPAVPLRRIVLSDGIPLAVDIHDSPAATAPTLVLVHGYPDNQSVWRDMLPFLTPHFRVVTYDVRGAGDSGRGDRLATYRLPALAADLRAVIDAVSPDQPVHLAGHDWGSIQSWEAVTCPSFRGRIASFTSASGPCLDHAAHWLRHALRQQGEERELALQQLKASWYIQFFHLPWLPPLAWRWLFGPRWRAIRQRLDGLDAPISDSQTRDGMDGIALYRANFIERLLFPRQRYANCPVHLLVAGDDFCVTPGLFLHQQDWVPQLTRFDLETGHWLPLAQPQVFAREICRHALGEVAA